MTTLARIELRRPEIGEGNLHLPTLVYGPNERDGVVHDELHRVFCRCAFHPMPEPHWHPCSEACAMALKQQAIAAGIGG